VVWNESLVDICDRLIQVLAATSNNWAPRVCHIHQEVLLKFWKMHMNHVWFWMIESAHLHSGTCPKTIFETDNSSIWFQSRDKNIYWLELGIRWIARFVTPLFLSNYSCPFMQLIIFLFSIVYTGVVYGLLSATRYVSLLQSTHSIICWLRLLPTWNLIVCRCVHNASHWAFMQIIYSHRLFHLTKILFDAG